MTYDFDFRLNMYTRWITLDGGVRVRMVSSDLKVWTALNLDVVTSKPMPTLEEQFKHHVYKMLPTKRHAPRLQAGNYHPPKQQRTLRKKHAELDQAAAIRSAHRNDGLKQVFPEQNKGHYTTPLSMEQQLIVHELPIRK